LRAERAIRYSRRLHVMGAAASVAPDPTLQTAEPKGDGLS
jgi:hypothetical protein